MKKFFTLACAAVLAISASAFTPVKNLKHGEKMEKIEKLARPIEKPAFVANDDIKAMPVRNIVKEHAMKAPARALAAATQDYAPVAFNYGIGYSLDAIYGDGSWELILCGNADTTMVVDLLINGPSTGVSIAGTYTTNDSCYAIVVRAEGDTLETYVNDETFTITYVSTDANGVPTYHLSGTLTAADAEDNDVTIQFDHDFTMDEALDYYYYYYFQQYYQYCMMYGVYCEEALECYNYMWITLLDEPVTPTGDTVQVGIITMPEVKYYEDFGLNRLVFRNAYDTLTNNSVIAAIFFEGDSLEAGTYTLNEGTYATYNWVRVYTATDTITSDINLGAQSTITVSEVQPGVTKFDIYLAARDGKVYHILGIYFIPNSDPQNISPIAQYDPDTEEWSFEVVADTTYLANLGDITLSGYQLYINPTDTTLEEALYVNLDFFVNDETFLGTYTEADFYEEEGQVFAYMYYAIAKIQLEILKANFSITDTDMDNIGDLLEGDFACNDGVLYHVTMPFVLPTPAPTAIKNNAADVKVEKVIKNGQLIIRKNGKEFNVMGAQL